MKYNNMMNYYFYALKRSIRRVKHSYERIFNYNCIPMPYFRKWKYLSKIFLNDTKVIETGTYLGETTIYLSKRYPNVITIEAFKELYDFNQEYLSKIENIEIIFGQSEHVLPDLLTKQKLDLNFWLDGHYSGGDTFGFEEFASPIIAELKAIGDWLSFNVDAKAVIAIDDARLFTDSTAGYPDISEVESFAAKHNLHFQIHNDIIVLSS